MKTFEEYQYKFSIPHNKAKVIYKYTLSTYEELAEAIKAEIKLQGPEADLNCIDTSEITDMSCLFDLNEHEYTKNFNGDISGWDVSSVENMYCMFGDAKSFNGDISNWDVSSVKDISGIFCGATSFNGDISKWDVSNVIDMGHAFGGAESFNGDISGWNVSSVIYMPSMFEGAKSFNQDISNWDMSNVKYYSNIFNGCPIKEEYKPKSN